MTNQEKIQSYDWAISKLTGVQAKLEQKEGLILAITTALQMSNGDDAKAGALVRSVMEQHRDRR